MVGPHFLVHSRVFSPCSDHLNIVKSIDLVGAMIQAESQGNPTKAGHDVIQAVLTEKASLVGDPLPFLAELSNWPRQEDFEQCN